MPAMAGNEPLNAFLFTSNVCRFASADNGGSGPDRPLRLASKLSSATSADRSGNVPIASFAERPIATTCVEVASQVTPYQPAHSVPGALNVGDPLAGQVPLHQPVLSFHPFPPAAV